TRRGCSWTTRSRRRRTPSVCRDSSCTRASICASRRFRSSERRTQLMKRNVTLLAAVLWLSTVALVPAGAQTLPAVQPEQGGLSSEQLGRVMVMLRGDSEEGQIPGAVLLVARHGQVALFEAAVVA